jgi:hypothetical protein
MMSMLCNCCVRELLILARTWFVFGLPSKTGCDIVSLIFIQQPGKMTVTKLLPYKPTLILLQRS